MTSNIYKVKYKGKIKIYSDGADRDSMIQMSQDPNITGLTTNPSLMKSAGIKDYVAFCKEILTQIKVKPISFEVFADDFSSMRKQAKEIATWGDNVYVKIPVMNSLGESSIPLIKELTHSGIKLNITAIFTLEQTIEVCKAVQDGAPAIISIFAGRIADTGVNPIPIMTEAKKICEQTGPEVELLWASTREVYNIVEAESLGCHIITVSPSIYKKISAFGKGLNQYSQETVLSFKKDAESLGYTI